VMTRGAVQRGRHVIGNLARGRGSVVAALAIAGDSGVVEPGGAPGQRPVAGTAFLGRRQVIARQGCRLHARMTAAAGIGGPDDEIGMIHADRVERIRRVTRAAVVVAGNMARILADDRYAIVTTETRAARGGVIHVDEGLEGIQRVTKLAVVLR
jgi:hypothetical protein